MPVPLVPAPRRPGALARGPRASAAPPRADGDRRPRRSGWTAVLAPAAALATASAALLLHGGPAPRPTPPPSPGAGAPHATAAAAATTTPDLTWTERQGVAIPSSRSAGPHRDDGVLQTGFAHDDLGAALAAVHVVYRASPAPGPTVFRAALDRQVTGDAREALRSAVERDYPEVRTAAGLPDGAPLPPGTGVLTGYRVTALAGGDRHVRVVEHAPDAQGSPGVYAVDVVMTWQDGDWRLVAPSAGTWNSAVTHLEADPPQTTAFVPASPGAGGGE